MNFQLLNLYPEPPLKFFQAKFINFTLTNTYNARVLFRVAHLLNILEVVNSSANYQIIPTKGLLQPSESKAIKIIPHQLHSQGEIVLEAIEYSDQFLEISVFFSKSNIVGNQRFLEGKNSKPFPTKIINSCGIDQHWRARPYEPWKFSSQKTSWPEIRNLWFIFFQNQNLVGFQNVFSKEQQPDSLEFHSQKELSETKKISPFEQFGSSHELNSVKQNLYQPIQTPFHDNGVNGAKEAEMIQQPNSLFNSNDDFLKKESDQEKLNQLLNQSHESQGQQISDVQENQNFMKKKEEKFFQNETNLLGLQKQKNLPQEEIQLAKERSNFSQLVYDNQIFSSNPSIINNQMKNSSLFRSDIKNPKNEYLEKLKVQERQLKQQIVKIINNKLFPGKNQRKLSLIVRRVKKTKIPYRVQKRSSILKQTNNSQFLDQHTFLLWHLMIISVIFIIFGSFIKKGQEAS